MSDSDDLEDVTPRISSEDSERLLAGAAGLDDAAATAEVSSVLRALRGPAAANELTGLASVLTAFGTTTVNVQNYPSTQRTIPMIKKRLTSKTLAAIGVVTLVSAGAAAAAGGVPTPFSSKPPASLSKDVDADDLTEETDDEVSVTEATTTTDEVETTEAIATTEAIDTTESLEAPVLADVAVDTDAQGPDVNGPAKFGLCTAYAARTKHDVTTTTELGQTPAAEPDSDSADLPVPFQALTDAAVAAGQSVADFCADAVPGGSADDSDEDGDNPSATAPGKSDDNPSATAPGKSDDNPSATAPGKSGGAPGHVNGSHGPASRHS
jgi:hypothetical protein